MSLLLLLLQVNAEHVSVGSRGKYGWFPLLPGMVVALGSPIRVGQALVNDNSHNAYTEKDYSLRLQLLSFKRKFRAFMSVVLGIHFLILQQVFLF